ncbi:MAG: C_GCAxxG_C_C family protein [Deltaproteobacteria bacterium]|nr:C_GCAxxG_C_C family protein [Deltaproteobacteria bacterium]
MEKDLLEKAYDVGFAFEQDYGGCAQCVIGALYQLFPDLRNEDVFRSATALGGGIGLTTQGGCGALAGAAMAISQMTGRSLANIADPEKKRFVAYRLGEKLVNVFIEEYGTVTCEKIQTKLMGRSFYMYEEWNEFLAAGGHSTACTSVVGNATRWAAEIIRGLKEKQSC